MQHLSYFAKAYTNAVYSGLIYLMANIAPSAAHLSDIPLTVWIGFAASILGGFGLTAIVTNGPKPVKETPATPSSPLDFSSLSAAPAAPVAVEAPVMAADVAATPA